MPGGSLHVTTSPLLLSTQNNAPYCVSHLESKSLYSEPNNPCEKKMHLGCMYMYYNVIIIMYALRSYMCDLPTEANV